jgi:tetratricopeptide (TPR) repeat protein
MTDTETTRVAHLSALEGYSDEGRPTWHPIRTLLGVQAFGINAWEATEAGQEVIGEHDEASDDATGHEELYLVTSGHARFTVDGREIDAPSGTLVFVSDPASKRAAVADEPGTTILAIGAKRGEAFEPSAWERAGAALRFWKTEEWDKAIELLSAEAANEPERGGTLYNLACAEARAGRTDDALAHLQRAVELQERLREAAQDDPDLEAIRSDPRFPAAA